MNTYIVSMTVIGIAALGMAWMPSISRRTNISYAIIYVLMGMALYSVFHSLPTADPIQFKSIALHLSELVVIVSLMGTGLKIDQPFSLKTWRVPIRLATLTMILCIGTVAASAYYLLGLDLASSLLLGAVLAPTDPVLASDVQVGPPQETDKENVRFSLTAEAGLNDGTAFPFTWLAITVALMAGGQNASITEWLVRDVLYRIVAGVACGILLGRLLAYLVFYLPEKKKFIVVRDGFVAVAATLMVYGITELFHGYGFFAVFIAAITLRNYELNHKYHKKLHDFTDQIERILVAIVLLLFGGSLVGGILKYLTLETALFGLAFILLIRPLLGLLTLVDTKLHFKEKWAISFFGIRGIGSFFYLSFALNETTFTYGPQLWSVVSFIVLISLVLHGVTASRSMEKLKREFTKQVPPQ